MLYLIKKDFLFIRKILLPLFLIEPFYLIFFQHINEINTNITSCAGLIIISCNILLGIMLCLFKAEERKEKGMLLCLGYSKKYQVICRSIYLLITPIIGSLLYSVLPIYLKNFQRITMVEFCFSFLVIIIINGYSLLIYADSKKAVPIFISINICSSIVGFAIIEKVAGVWHNYIEKFLFGNVYRNSVMCLVLAIIILCFYVSITIKIYEKNEV